MDRSPVSDFWESLPSRLPATAECVLIISAHWESNQLTLAGRTAQPSIQYDFQGFPDTLYRLRWPLPDGRDDGARLLKRLHHCGLDVSEEAERPFDHGVWVPLVRAWPAMPIPVFQLSLVRGWQGEDYLQLGEHIAALRDTGVLLIGSGSLTHNLHDLDLHAPANTPEPWAKTFMGALLNAIAHRDLQALAHPWRLPHGRRALPTLEHYWPLVMIAACSELPLSPLFAHWQYGTLAMHSFVTSDHNKGEQ